MQMIPHYKKKIGWAASITALIFTVAIVAVGDGFTEVSNDTRMAAGGLAEGFVSGQVSNISRSDIILDISPEAEEYVQGAISINYEDFLDGSGDLKPVKEIADIIGQAGISKNDSVAITGECLPCGGGPAPAAFTYWVFSYLGHEKVRILEGDVKDAAAAGINTSSQPSIRLPTAYDVKLRPELMATYDLVSNGDVQVVDARSPEDFDLGSIPGSINVPYESVLDNESILSVPRLEEIFAGLGLSKESPVIVYTNTGVQASTVWLALEQSGYDARLYSWKDWLENQPQTKLELVDATAEPNPVRSGGTVTISATFGEGSKSQAQAPGTEMMLTVQGCVTCGFGSPQSFAKIDQKNGVIQLGSSTRAFKVEDKTLKCTAVISAPDGSEVARVSLLRTTGDRYMGLWNARVPAGVYNISIMVSTPEASRSFANVIKLDVV